MKKLDVIDCNFLLTSPQYCYNTTLWNAEVWQKSRCCTACCTTCTTLQWL